MEGCGLNGYSSEEEQVAGSRKYGNEHLDRRKFRELTHWMTNC